MRKSILAFASLAFLLPLSGCDNQNSSSENNTQDNLDTVVTPKDDYQDMSKVTGIKKKISIDWGIYDPSIKYKFCTGVTYSVTYSFDSMAKEGASIEVADHEIGEIILTNVGFNFKAKKAGNTYITIKDADGYTHYRQVLMVRQTVSEKRITDYLLAVDHYESWRIFDNNLSLTFIDKETAMIKGYDEGTNIGSFEFNYAFDRKDDLEYRFNVTNWKNNVTSWNVFKLSVTLNGTMLHLTSGSLAAPSSLPFTQVLSN